MRIFDCSSDVCSSDLDMLFVRPTVILVFDRLADALYLVAPVWQGSFSDSGKAIEEAFERIDATAARLSGPLPASAAFMPEEENVVVTPVLAPGRYGEMVAAAKDYISAGEHGRAHVCTPVT